MTTELAQLTIATKVSTAEALELFPELDSHELDIYKQCPEACQTLKNFTFHHFEIQEFDDSNEDQIDIMDIKYIPDETGTNISIREAIKGEDDNLTIKEIINREMYGDNRSTYEIMMSKSVSGILRNTGRQCSKEKFIFAFKPLVKILRNYLLYLQMKKTSSRKITYKEIPHICKL